MSILYAIYILLYWQIGISTREHRDLIEKKIMLVAKT